MVTVSNMFAPNFQDQR